VVFSILILLPFDFHAPEVPRERSGPAAEGAAAVLGALGFRLSRSIGHFFLFLPLAPLLAWTFRWSWRDLYAVRTVLSIFAAAFGSELAQLHVSRGVSLLDANMNIFGYAVGVALVAIWHELRAPWRSLLERSRPAVSILGVVASVAVMILLLLPVGGLPLGPRDLNVWSSSYPLIMGNELTKSRPWTGLVETCGIYPGAFPPGAEGARPPPAVLYDFRSEDLVICNAGELCSVRGRPGPELVLLTGFARGVPGGGIDIALPSVLQTPDGWREGMDALRKAGAFTLEVCFTPHSSDARGPARIVSSSINNRQRNFTLGQEGKSLELRVRTPLTGPNGTGVTLRVDEVVEAGRKVHVVATYDRGRLELHVDGKLRGIRKVHILGWLCPQIFHEPLDGTMGTGLGVVAWAILLVGVWASLPRRLAGRKALPIAALCAFVLLGLVLGGTALAAPDPGPSWPAWRGPRGDGVSPAPAPTAWSRTEGVSWAFADPGVGYSSPIVHGDSVFFTTAAGEARLLLGLALADGKEIWRVEVLRAPREGMHIKNSAASATPATDGERIYTAFFAAPRVMVKAHDLSGKEVWSASPGEFHSIHGFCATPVLHRDLVILNCDQDADAYIVALERKTGKVAWRTDRENKLRSYCPPLFFEAGGRTQMALSGSKTISSYDPLTGKRIWVCDGPTEQCVASLVHGSGIVFVTGGYPDREILAIDPTGSGDVTGTHVRWRSPRGVAYVPSPVYHAGHFFVVSDTGVLSAIEARSGDYRGQKRLDGNFSASLLIAGSHLYAFSEEGIVHVFRAGPGLEPQRRIDMGETIFATPAALPGMLLLRTSKQLIAIRGTNE